MSEEKEPQGIFDAPDAFIESRIAEALECCEEWLANLRAFGTLLAT